MSSKNKEQNSPFLSIEQAPKSQNALRKALDDLFPAKNPKSLCNLVHNRAFIEEVCAQAAVRRVQTLDYYKGCSVALRPQRRSWWQWLLFLPPKDPSRTLVVRVEEPKQKWKLTVQTSAGIKNTVALGANVKGSIRNLFGTLAELNGCFGMGAGNMEDSVTELTVSQIKFVGGGRENLARWLLRRKPTSAPFCLNEAVDVAEGKSVLLSCGCRLLSRDALHIDEEDLKENKSRKRPAVAKPIPKPEVNLNLTAPKKTLSAFAVANAGPGGAIGLELCHDFNDLDEMATPLVLLFSPPRVRLWHMLSIDRMTRSGYHTRRFRWGATITNEVSADLCNFEQVAYRKHSAAAQMTIGFGKLGALDCLSRSVPYPVDFTAVLNAGTMYSLGSKFGRPSTYAAHVHGFENMRSLLVRSIEMRGLTNTSSLCSYLSLNSTLSVVMPLPDKVRKFLPVRPLMHAFADIGTISSSPSLLTLARNIPLGLRAAVGAGFTLELGAGAIEFSFCVPILKKKRDVSKKYNLSLRPGIF